MNRFTLSLCGLALLAGLTGCKHSDPTPPPPAADPLTLLPKETQTGENTFGCLINGKAYFAPPATYASGDWVSTTMLSINGQVYEDGNALNSRAAISLVLNGDLSGNKSVTFGMIPTGTPHTIFTSGQNQFFAFTSAPNGLYYSGKTIKYGQSILTKFDGVARVASGRFAFSLYEPGSSDTLRVTDGRFDVKF